MGNVCDFCHPETGKIAGGRMTSKRNKWVKISDQRGSSVENRESDRENKKLAPVAASSRNRGRDNNGERKTQSEIHL